MKEIVQQILGYLPKYIPEFLRVFSSPRSAISERNQGQSDDIKQALIFFGISFFLIFPFQRALIPSQLELWAHIAQSVALALFIGLASAALIRLAWRIVGGSAPVERFVVAYCYLSGVTLVIYMFAILISLGALKTFYPDSYKPVTTMLFSVGRSPFDLKVATELQRLPGYGLYNTLLSLLDLLALTWYVIAWGAYRQLTGLTKPRSIAAFVLSFIFLLPVVISSFFIQRLFM